MPEPDIEAINKNRDRAFALQARVIAYNEKYKSFTDIRKNLTKMNELISSDMDFADEHKKIYETVNREYNTIIRALTNRREGLARDMFGLNVLYTATGSLTGVEEESVNNALMAMDKAEEMIDTFLTEHWDAYINFFRERNITLDKILR